MKKYITVLMLIILSGISISGGCSRKELETVVTVGDKKLTPDDFKYDIFLIETEGNSLEEHYLSNYGMSYWDYVYGESGATMRDLAKDSVLSKVIMNEILAGQSEKAGFSLSEQEIAANEKAVDSFIAKTGNEVLDAEGLTRGILMAAFNRTSLGHKYYLEVTKSFDIDIEAIKSGLKGVDYREYKTECLYAPSVFSKDQQIIPLTDEELTKSLDAIREAKRKVEEGLTFQQILEEAGRLTYYSRNFIISDGTAEQLYKDAATMLRDGEYSDIISTDYGYYIIHMLDNNSEERYEQAIEEVVAAEENRQFEAVYNEWKTLYEIDINTEYWDSITIG